MVAKSEVVMEEEYGDLATHKIIDSNTSHRSSQQIMSYSKIVLCPLPAVPSRLDVPSVRDFVVAKTATECDTGFVFIYIRSNG